MEEVLVTFLVSCMAMALAYVGLLRMGVVAGASGPDEQLGIGALGVGMILMGLQAALWLLCGLYLARVLS